MSRGRTAIQPSASNDTASNDTASNDTASNDTASNDTASNDTASNDRGIRSVTTPRVLTLGGPIVAALPVEPVPHAAGVPVRWSVGGAELNVAVGLRRLGVEVDYVGRVGDDPLGAIVSAHLDAEGVGSRWLSVDPERATDVYLREWLPDGVRRLVYYRNGTAGGALSVDDIPVWSQPPTLLHLTGITPALGPSAAEAVESAVGEARRSGVPISFDPNHRARLWSADEARPVLTALAARAHLLLLSDEDAAVLFPGKDHVAAVASAHDLGPRVVVLKRGSEGALVSDGDGLREVSAEHVATAVDPVGAGDAFDAGFLAGWLWGWDVLSCAQLGARSGARAVEQPGEHDAAPHLADLGDFIAEIEARRPDH